MRPVLQVSIKPNGVLHGFDLAEEGADGGEVVGAPVAEETGGSGGDSPLGEEWFSGRASKSSHTCPRARRRLWVNLAIPAPTAHGGRTRLHSVSLHSLNFQPNTLTEVR